MLGLKDVRFQLKGVGVKGCKGSKIFRVKG